MANILLGQYYGRGGQTGELEIFDPERPRRYPTFSCSHCGGVKIVRPNTPPQSYCSVCDKIVCPKCHAKGGCEPWERQMEAMERRDRLYRSIHSV